MKLSVYTISQQLENVIQEINSFSWIKAPKMKEACPGYMDIPSKIRLLKKKWFLYEENDIPSCLHLHWMDLLHLMYLKVLAIEKDLLISFSIK